MGEISALSTITSSISSFFDGLFGMFAENKKTKSSEIIYGREAIVKQNNYEMIGFVLVLLVAAGFFGVLVWKGRK